ncbi:peptidoglycan recognition protein family protein, partial [Selenomonas sp. F0473]|uniref:peptidoglycan recognition protein family protein n=1 Tax=Selenomonas sp. F0473 TaxID=999423 RepID=UPI0025EC8FD5
AEIHASHRAQGWAGIGYHYVVRKDGTVEAGRPHWTIGAHAYGENGHTIGIHVCGNFEIAEPTDAQIESLAMLLANLCTDYGLPIDDDHVSGHCELMPTACPGMNLYVLLPYVRGKANWYAQN